MADDMTDKISSILNNPEMLGMLSSILNKDTGDSGAADSDAGDALIPASSGDIFSALGSADDKRIRLLSALKPYMKQRRASDIDKAIKMLKLTKISSILKDL